MACSSIFVVSNSLRLRGFKSEASKGAPQERYQDVVGLSAGAVEAQA
jgi:hypothetical protein